MADAPAVNDCRRIAYAASTAPSTQAVEKNRRMIRTDMLQTVCADQTNTRLIR